MTLSAILFLADNLDWTCIWSWPSYSQCSANLSSNKHQLSSSQEKIKGKSRAVAGKRLEMKVAPAEGSVSPSLKVTSAAPIGGSSPSVKVTPPIEEKSDLGLGQTSLQPTGKTEGNTKLEVPGQTKLDLAGLSKPNQTNLPEKSSPSSEISQTSLQQSAISDCYQHPKPSRSGGFPKP